MLLEPCCGFYLSCVFAEREVTHIKLTLNNLGARGQHALKWANHFPHLLDNIIAEMKNEGFPPKKTIVFCILIHVVEKAIYT